METKKETYKVVIFKVSGNFLKEMTRDEFLTYLDFHPDYFVESVEQIIDSCDGATEDTAWIDLDIIRENAERMLKLLELYSFESKKFEAKNGYSLTGLLRRE